MATRIPPHDFGFTIVELIVAMAVAAILLGLAVPSFQETIRNNRMAANVNEFVGALNLARSEAIKRGMPVTVCKDGGGGAACNPPPAAQWEQGWIVFSDRTGNGAVDAADSDTVLRVYPALRINYTFRGNNPVINRVTYNTRGFAVAGTLVMCDDRGFGANARAIVIARTGRAQSIQAPASTLTTCT